MTGKNTELTRALTDFIARYLTAYKEKYNHLPLIEHDDEWPSPCIDSEHKPGEIDYWQPIECREELSFENVDEALELELHPDIKTLLTTFYSDTLDASCEHGDLSLLLLWSELDFARLQENIIGHIVMKRRLKQETTVFFGLTDEEDIILSIKNDTGEVWVERVGKEPHKKLNNSLAEFVESLTPKIP